MKHHNPRYLSYLLRLWETSDGEKQIWRASLESPGSGERTGFANLQGLIDFLETQTGQAFSSRGTPSGHAQDDPRGGSERA